MLTCSGRWCLSEPWKIASPGHGLLPAASTGFLSATPHSSKCKPDHVSSLFKASAMVPYCSSDRPTSCLASHLFPLPSSSPPTLPLSPASGLCTGCVLCLEEPCPHLPFPSSLTPIILFNLLLINLFLESLSRPPPSSTRGAPLHAHVLSSCFIRHPIYCVCIFLICETP